MNKHSFIFLSSCAIIICFHQFELLADGGTTPLQVAVFSADITPPLGPGIGIDYIVPARVVETPLLAKGVVLRDRTGVAVLCAVDLCGLANETFLRFRAAIAAAVDTTPDRVALQSLHQHTAPTFDESAQKLLFSDQPEQLLKDRDAIDAAIDRTVAQIIRATQNWQTVSHVGWEKAKVERVASNRRVPDAEGRIQVRWSSTKDPELIAAPAGVIDPWLRVVTLYRQTTDHKTVPVVQLHYYATHPQTSTGHVHSADIVGIARQRLQTQTGVPQIYFNGCGGNITLGKYNDGSAAAKTVLADRLFQAMSTAATKSQPRQPVQQYHWHTTQLQFKPRREPEFSAAYQQAILVDQNASKSARIKAAMCLAWLQQLQAGRTVTLSQLTLGPVRILHLPGEPFVQYQLFAQAIAKNERKQKPFVAVAGYGECGTWYIGDDRIYTDQGGFEQTWAFSAPIEQELKTAIQKLLGIP